MRQLFILFILCAMCMTAGAQSIVITSGSVEPLQNEKTIKFEFTYNEMLVGKMTEQDYVNKKVTEHNKKEAGKGDEWRENWINSRKERYEPKFIELFDKYMEKSGIVAGGEEAKFVIIFNTDFSEPGWNVGVMRQNASIDLSGKVINIETNEQVATVKIRNASANNFWGTDFDTAYRLQETYAKAGRQFAKFLIKKWGK